MGTAAPPAVRDELHGVVGGLAAALAPLAAAEVVDHDLAPVPGQLHGVATADAVTRAGDDRDLAVEQSHVRVPCVVFRWRKRGGLYIPSLDRTEAGHTIVASLAAGLPRPPRSAGVRVLDLATLFPAPMVAAMLGDLGADVVKVEPPTGDPLRVTGAMRGGRTFALGARRPQQARGERRLRRQRAGSTSCSASPRSADVVVLNQPPRVLERWGCTLRRHRGAQPGRDRGDGQRLRHRRAPTPGARERHASLEAYGGLTHMTGDADGPPVLSSVPIGDCMGAFFGVSGVLAALTGGTPTAAPGSSST